MRLREASVKSPGTSHNTLMPFLGKSIRIDNSSNILYHDPKIILWDSSTSQRVLQVLHLGAVFTLVRGIFLEEYTVAHQYLQQPRENDTKQHEQFVEMT